MTEVQFKDDPKARPFNTEHIAASDKNIQIRSSIIVGSETTKRLRLSTKNYCYSNMASYFHAEKKTVAVRLGKSDSGSIAILVL